jgi:two-component system, OmpR family, response regulator
MTFSGLFRSITLKARITQGEKVTMEVIPAASPAPNYRDEHLSIDFDRQLAELDSTRITLTRKEYDLLALLVQNAGQIVPRDILLLRVWGYGSEIRTRTLDVHVRRLRKKLGSYADQYIETIFGIGYRFQPYSAPRYFRAPMKPALAMGA